MRTYDTTFVLDGRISPEEREALITRFADILEKLGGKMDRIVRWGMRPLAYEINKRSRGYYVIFYHNSEPDMIRPLEHDLGLSEYVLRYMTLICDGVHPSYIHDEGQQAEAGDLPPEIEESDDDVDMLDDSDEAAADIEMIEDEDAFDEEKDEDDAFETQDDSGDTESAPEEASDADDTDESVKEAE